MSQLEKQVKRQRIQSIDLLRGLCVLFLVCHTRYFLEFYGLEGLGLERIFEISTSFFFLRLLTHPVAPIFLFLAGISIFLYWKRRNLSRTELSLYLLKRGVFLIILDIFVVGFSWRLGFDYILIQVLSSIGLSMIFFSFLLYLPRKILLFSSIFFIIFQQTIYSLIPFSLLGIFGSILISNTHFVLFGKTVYFVFPILIAVAVLSLGYSLGPFFMKKDSNERKKYFLYASFIFISLFFFLRFLNIYGDPNPWEIKETFFNTLLSFLDITKYPYSLIFLLLSAGVGSFLLYLFESLSFKVPPKNVLLVFGRSPLFFYLLHIYVIHFFLFLLDYFFHKEVFSFFELLLFSFFVLIPMYYSCLIYQYYKRKYFSQKENPFKALKNMIKKKNERST